MHKLAEKIADCLKAKVEGKGIDNIEGQDLVEFELWSKVIKNLVCYDKDKKIIEAMDEAEESEEAMKYIEMYEDYPERKGYRGQPRDSRGRYMSRRGGRRGYEEPMYYQMTPEMYHMYPAEYYRDMDRESGKMYYSGGSSNSGGPSSGGMSGGSAGMSGGQSSGGSSGGSMGYSESGRGSQGGRGQSSRSENARRGYEEAKMMQDGSPESKKKAMESLENYMKELGEEMSELIGKMDSSEKSMLKNKLQTLAQRVS